MKANYFISEAVKREILLSPIFNSEKTNFKFSEESGSALDFVAYLKKLSFVLIAVSISIIFSLLIQ